MAPIAQFLPDLGQHQSLIYSVLILFAAFLVIYNYTVRIRYPANLLRIGEPPGKTSFRWRTRLRYYTDCRTLFREAYDEYSKKGKSVLIPGLGFRDELILPQSSMKWILAKNDDDSSTSEAFAEMDQVLYSMGHPRYVTDAWQGMLVKTEINAILERVCDTMNNELGVAFDKYFGTDTEEWREVDLLKTIRMIVAQAASRFTTGLPLCRNEEYLKDSVAILDKLILNAGLTGAAPKLLRPLVGPLVSWSIPGNVRRIQKHFEPILKERLETLKYPRDDPDHPEPQDHLQMMLRYAQKERPLELTDNLNLTKRLIAANFGSMHQTSIQVTNMLLNIMGSDAEFNTISVLRDEVLRVLGPDVDPENTHWTKATVAKLVRADSVARETMRLNSFGGRAVMRKIMVDGIVTPDGIALPKGCLVSYLAQPAQTDAANVEDPLKYDPFRFSRVREANENSADGDTGTKTTTAGLTFVSTSPEHLPFGHGKHACPGRFLVDFEMKMIIAYVLMNYEVEFPKEYNGKRPENIWMTEAVVPPPGVRIRVKRRKQAV